MPSLRNIAGGIRSLFQRKRADRELDEELRGFMDMAAEESMKQGTNQKDARRAVRLERGSVEAAKEVVRSAAWESLLETSWQDVCYGLRILRKSPGFTAVAVLTLALGIGANTAIFSVIDAVLLHPLPYKNPSQLVFVMESNPRSAFGEAEASLSDINDWRATSKTIHQFAAFDWQNYFLTGGREPELVWGLRVSPEFFSTLGVLPLRGSAFSPKAEESGNRVAVISDALWQEHFGGNPGVVGRTVVLNDTAYTIIGVMPPGFQFPPQDIIPGMDPQIFTPLIPTPEEASQRDDRVLAVIARLNQGVSVEQAGAELSTIADSLARRYPTINKGWGIEVTPVNEEAIGNMRLPLLILACAVGLLLLLACANVANLLLGRNASRNKEMALRAALGASPFRIVRQMLTESLLLALLSGVLGVIVGGWTLGLLVSSFPANIPRIADIRLDWIVLLFSFALASLTTLMFGLLPALRAARPCPHQQFKSFAARFSVRSHLSTPRSLATLQVAISLVLLIGAGLLIHSMMRLLTNDAGFSAEGVLTARIELPPNRYRTPGSVESFHQRVLEQVSALPGVDSAAIAMTLPLSGRSTVMYAEPQSTLDGAPAQPTVVEYNAVTLEYFRTMRVSLLAGRDFSHADEHGEADVAIVNQALARQFWPKESPIGKYFRFGQTPWLQVIGLVKNEKYWSLTDSGKPEFYVPYHEAARFGASYLMHILTFLVIRSPLRPDVLSSEIRLAVWRVDPNEPVVDLKTMDRLVSDSIARRRFATLLLSVLGGLAAVLALTGLYSVLAFSVSRRTREIGIRMALGAQKTDILGTIVVQGLGLTLIGVAIGIAGALSLTQFLSSLLYVVRPTDPLTFIAVSLIFTGVALLASYIPARRAMRVDPMVALRYE